jgi:S-layer homology domain
MLDRAFPDKPVTAATTSFKDIPKDYPRKEAVDKSVQLGFMSGYSPTKFAPNQVIPRYQLQISLAKGLNLPLPASSDTVLKSFPDADNMPKYAREKMAAAVADGLVIKDKTPNLLKPVQNATRADAAALIYGVLVKEGKIKPAQ